VAEELQQDDSLARHLGEAAAKLVEGSLTPTLVQASMGAWAGGKRVAAWVHCRGALQAAGSGCHCRELLHASSGA
jgi:hypothetical protein